MAKRKSSKSGTETISACVPIQVYKEIQNMIKKGEYRNVSDVVNDAVRRFLKEKKLLETHELVEIK